MIDLDAIKARLAAVHAAGISVIHTRLVDHSIRVLVSMRDWSGTNRYDADAAVTTLLGNAPIDIAALVEEVERLRELLLNAGWPREAEGGAELAAGAERAAVVAWLRAEAEASAQTYTLQAGEWANRIDGLADDIARGEHRSEVET